MKAIKALEKIAIDMPEVCIMDTFIAVQQPRFDTEEAITEYFSPIGEITRERCGTIISESGETVGEYDFFFEWFTEPNQDQFNMLIERVDDALSPLGCKYTITTSGSLRKPHEAFAPERLINIRKFEIKDAMEGKVSFIGVSSEELLIVRELFEDLIDLKCDAKEASLTKDAKDQIINLFLLLVKKTGDSL